MTYHFPFKVNFLSANQLENLGAQKFIKVTQKYWTQVIGNKPNSWIDF